MVPVSASDPRGEHALPDDEPQLSPAERFARARASRTHPGSQLGLFAAGLDFPLDDFQVRACAEVEDGRGVLVAAPTGAGKTVVGEFAVHLALARGAKAFYTTPIKALSNQKYADLARVHGEDRVGLLTGDTSVNPDAQVVVMTTEVLRNMLYSDAEALTDLGYVVMDEVHYLADRFRGPVWEEVIIHLPEHVQVISLSATVSNAEEFGAWLDTVRGATSVVVSEHRPVPLWQHVMAGNRLYDLFAEDVAFEETADRDGSALLNPELKRLALEAERGAQRADWGRPSRPGQRDGRGGPKGRGKGGRGGGREERSGGRGDRGGRGGSSGASGWDRERPAAARVDAGVGERRGPRLATSRPETVRVLDRAGLLPCITFIFSRAGCDGAVEQCLRAGLDLTTPREKALVFERAEEVARLLPPEDLEVLGFWAWRDGLSRGFAAHHAGMLPPFKEAVEDLFVAGALKAVFATETLALGINMPARSVVIEKLVKFNGESHVDITAGEYTQLTGRAGRRGIDVEGHAVVMWRPGLDPAAVAGLASRRTYPLRSSFRPTYNMSVNLLAQVGAERARGILESSFAQFQADRSVVGLAREVRSKEASLQKYADAMACHLGDMAEYIGLRKELASAQKSGSQGRRARLAAVKDSLADLAPGDVITLEDGARGGHAVVVFPAGNPQNPRVGVITETAQLRRITVDDVAAPVDPVAGAALPQLLRVKTPEERRNVAGLMREALRTDRPPTGGRRRATGFRLQEDPLSPRVEELRRALERHPCHGCSDREEHVRWGERWWGMRRELSVLRERIAGRTNTISRTFDRVVTLLRSYDYVRTDVSSPAEALTERGQALRRIYGERDLFTSLVLQDPSTRSLTPEEWACVAALLVYQGKGETRGVLPMPTARLARVAEAAEAIEADLAAAESAARLDPTPPTDPGLVAPVHRWVRGKSLRDTLQGADLAAGDFVRWARQVIDVLDQLAQVPGDAHRSRACRRAAGLVARGVVATSLPGGGVALPPADDDD